MLQTDYEKEIHKQTMAMSSQQDDHNKAPLFNTIPEIDNTLKAEAFDSNSYKYQVTDMV